MKLEGQIESRIKQTLKKVKLSKKEKILVAMSGGKDSVTTIYFLHKLGYNIEGLHINLGMGKYSEDCLNDVVRLCCDLNVKLHIYDIKKEMGSSMCYLRTSIQKKHLEKAKGEIKNCAICGVIKKWVLNKVARELGFSIIATGHNLDDEAQTFFMNILKGSPELSVNTGVMTQNKSDKKFVTRLKPLFYVLEGDIRNFTKQKKLPVLYQSCPCLIDSYRKTVREWMRDELTEKEKVNLVNNFDGLRKRIDKLRPKGLVNYCDVCSEPCRGKLCKKCKLFTLK